jgi:hypothetical protein
MKTRVGETSSLGQDPVVVAGLERSDVARIVLSFARPSVPLVVSLAAFDTKVDDVQTVLRTAGVASMPAGNLLFAAEPSMSRLQHLALPPAYSWGYL